MGIRNGIGTVLLCCCCVVVATVGFGRGLGALKSAATVTSFVFLFTVLCFLYFVTVNQFCMSDFFTRLRQLYNLLTPSWASEEGARAWRMQGAWQHCCRVAGRWA